jgi:hypothetical protein
VCELLFIRLLPDKQGAHCNRSGALTQRLDLKDVNELSPAPSNRNRLHPVWISIPEMLFQFFLG